ncbi:sulfotransferase family protein [Nocardioides sp. Bht2]|uniref:sulfotransferase family protein n=1 Tax=Nocardioides sp. Bht2 TaxID=3392297 RepID=UPI0039B593C1
MPDARLILITGTGRSGTSTMSGLFHHLGVEVPGPHLGANDSNPKGFYESRWSVRFHEELCSRARMHVMDSRPSAFEDVQAVIGPRDRAKLTRWVAKVGAGHDQIVVKDPRSVWTQQLWAEAAAADGRESVYISMLRPPAETIGSRAAYYASADEAKRRRYEIFNIARWVNNQVVSERETRSASRSFVAYADLLTDWRAEAERLATELGIVWPGEIAAGVESPVDDFISPDLRRVQVTWDDLEIPAELRQIADEVWAAVTTLRDAGGHHTEASAAMDDLSERYQELFRRSSAISHDAIEARLAEYERAQAQAQSAEPPAPAGDRRAITDVGSRELIGVLASRARSRLRRS